MKETSDTALPLGAQWATIEFAFARHKLDSACHDMACF